MAYKFDADIKLEATRVLAALRGGAGIAEFEERLAMDLALFVLQCITEDNLVYSVLLCHSFMRRMKLQWQTQKVWTHDRAFKTNKTLQHEDSRVLSVSSSKTK